MLFALTRYLRQSAMHPAVEDVPDPLAITPDMVTEAVAESVARAVAYRHGDPGNWPTEPQQYFHRLSDSDCVLSTLRFVAEVVDVVAGPRPRQIYHFVAAPDVPAEALRRAFADEALRQWSLLHTAGEATGWAAAADTFGTSSTADLAALTGDPAALARGRAARLWSLLITNISVPYDGDRHWETDPAQIDWRAELRTWPPDSATIQAVVHLALAEAAEIMESADFDISDVLVPSLQRSPLDVLALFVEYVDSLVPGGTLRATALEALDASAAEFAQQLAPSHDAIAALSDQWRQPAITAPRTEERAL